MQISATTQALSFTGAMLILVGYVGHQLKWMDPRKPPYNIINAAGSAILGVVALRPFQLGFVVLEFAWVAVSLYALARSMQAGGKI